MRFVSIFGLALALTACATSAPTSQTTVSGASIETLKPGECGMFGWSTDRRRDFIFFADADSARFNGENGPIDLVAQAAFPALDYLDAEGRTVSLRLGDGEIMSGGMRYPGARIVTLTDEGWERLQPVALVRSCQPR
jgi:hypothetical protein